MLKIQGKRLHLLGTAETSAINPTLQNVKTGGSMEAVREHPIPDEDLAQVEEMCRTKAEITAEIKKVIVGQEKVIEEILIALFCRGH